MTLEEAIMLADEALVRRMLPSYIGTEVLDDGLRDAVMLGQPAIARQLLAAGADPDVRTPPIDREALAATVTYSPPPEERAEIDASYELYKKNNPLLFDEYAQYTDLLVGTLDPRQEDADLATPLIHLSSSDFYVLDPVIVSGEVKYDRSERLQRLAKAEPTRAELVDLLLAAGADVHARDTIGRTPLLAVSFTSSIGVKLLSPGGYYPLGPLEPMPIIKRLLAAGADVNARDSAGGTILIRMAGDDPAIVRLLLDAGATVTSRDRHGATPLRNSASSSNAEVVRLLLDAGADVDIRDDNGFTPLHHAAHRGHARTASGVAAAIETVRILIDAGADVRARGAKGRTPLHLAAGNGALEDIVRALIDAGAVAEAEDELGNTPHDLAAHRRNEHLVSILRRVSQPG